MNRGLACFACCAAIMFASPAEPHSARNFRYYVGYAGRPPVLDEAVAVLKRNGIPAIWCGMGGSVGMADNVIVDKESNQPRAVLILSRMTELRKRGLVLFRMHHDPGSKDWEYYDDPGMKPDPGAGNSQPPDPAVRRRSSVRIFEHRE